MSLTGHDSDIDTLAYENSVGSETAFDLSHNDDVLNQNGSRDHDNDGTHRGGSDIDISSNENGDEEDDRENRFDGSASNWRFFTEDERSLAASLDQQQANNLSIHLYNAHALKAGAHDNAAPAMSRSRRRKKRRGQSDPDDSLSWLPDVAWTAWPMKPELVPRRGEQFGVPTQSREDDEATYRRKGIWKHSADLEDEIKALILRKAKQQFRNAAVQGFTPGPFQMIVDEDKIDSLLDPTVRRIVSEFDELLLGLHKGRQGLSRDVSRSQSKRSSSRNKSREPERNTVDTVSDDRDTHPEGPAKEAKRRRPLDTRDWSEILNVALLTGWKPDVVNRAAARCASLFGESDILAAETEATTSNGIDRTRSVAKDEAVEESLVRTPIPAYYCPITNCKRKNEPFDKAWRWREHLKRSHKYSTDDIEELEASLAS